VSSFGKKTRNPGFKSGDNWISCDVCGMDIYASDSKKRWDGLIVCPEDWEMRHPQDFVRARKDKISASVVRSEPEDKEISITYSNQGADNTIPSGTFNEDTL